MMEYLILSRLTIMIIEMIIWKVAMTYTIIRRKYNPILKKIIDTNAAIKTPGYKIGMVSTP